MDILDYMNDNGLDECILSRQRCDIVYRRTSDDGCAAVQCIPKDGNLVFLLSGQMAGVLPPVDRAFLARTIKEARERYYGLFGWRASSCRQVTGKELEHVLNDPLLFPL